MLLSHINNSTIYNPNHIKMRYLFETPDNLEKLRCCDFVSLWRDQLNADYRRILPSTIIYKFRRTYYEMKCKNKLRQILWDKIRRPKIEAKYSPDNLRVLLQSMENEEDMAEFEKILWEW